MYNILVVIRMQQVLGGAPAVYRTRRCVLVAIEFIHEDHGREVHAAVVVFGTLAQAIVYCLGVPCFHVRLKCVQVDVVARLKSKAVKDTRLLLHHKVALPWVSVHGVDVNKLPVHQTLIDSTLTPVVIDQLGLREEARHGHVVRRLM